MSIRSTTFSCVLMGTESLLIQCAEILLQRHHHIRGIITSEPVIQQWAQEHEIPQIEPGPRLADRLDQQTFDYLFSITNLSIIPDAVLALPRKGAINFHDGPLPRYAGLYATSWALINQERRHGITWHRMSSGVDQGDILKQRSVAVSEGETAFTLNVQCYEAAIASFAELVDELASDRVECHPQNLAERTYFARHQRPPAAGILSWQQSAEALSALVRALDFGPYANPLGLPKLVVGDDVVIVPEMDVLETVSQAVPGTITAIDEDGLKVATASHEIALRQLLTIKDQPLSIADFVAKLGIGEGDRLPELDGASAAHLSALNRALCSHEAFWRRRLAALESIDMPYADHSRSHADPAPYATVALSIPAAIDACVSAPDTALNRSDFLTVAFAAYLARLSGAYAFDLGLSTAAGQDSVIAQRLFASQVPVRVALEPSESFTRALEMMQTQLARVRQHKSYALDAVLRYPDLSPLRDRNGASLLPVAVAQVNDLDSYTPLAGTELTLLLSPDGRDCRWVHDPAVLDPARLASMQHQFGVFLEQIAADRNRRLDEIPLLSEADQHQLLVEWNNTQADYPRHHCIHHLFEAQVEQTPNATAVVFEDQSLTYRQLNHRANQLAHHLRRLNVGPETLVGIYLERSPDMIVGLMGVLKAGGAYVPLDPTYPADRIAFMVEDSQVSVLLTQAQLVNGLPPHQAQVVSMDADWPTIATESIEPVESRVGPDNLSYVIYTSGSTGKPKGVMVCHRNVVNFFTGMDARIPHDPPGVWLAVTSLSFDISVLELFWTLARGFKVVFYAEPSREQAASAPLSPHVHKEIAFSLFYFSSDESEQGNTDKYKLLLEGAKFADQHGFAAVWTPERHFHAFGGLYPNPSVASAAIAAVTEHVGIRAGSCVLPLHNPIRVAEEWAIVDNISQGRVGISFAAGWQPNDFVLRPETHADSKAVMFRDIDVVRRLWRGETIPVPGPLGQDVAVKTLPRPVQADLPVWITTAGNPETFRQTGAGGFNLLTHLLGQDTQTLAENLAIYRKAWVEHGHPGHGHVTLMMHTFIGDDVDDVRNITRQPMMAYLKSSVGLIKDAAWQFPTFQRRAEASGKTPGELVDMDTMTEEDMEALAAFSFERYFETSGLFGTPESCLQMVNTLKAMEVDEIACLIDFGVPSATVLQHLQHLQTLKALSAPKSRDEDYSIAAQITRHQVTHMQCTPSMASMLTMDEANRAALSTIRTFMVGGEAFPVGLAADLQALIAGEIINMYGPTETTIWSSTYTLDGPQDTIPIGYPIANTELYIVDANLQPVPIGVAGELYIGGDGVVRGYLHRPELTDERFLSHPWREQPGARVYRTGDLARYRPDGNIDFLGRIDNQVKIRGYRIELGEIETVLETHPGVREAVVVAREDTPGDKRLVAYLTSPQDAKPSINDLRSFLQTKLTDAMVPAAFVSLPALPLTPNGKVNRLALPAPDTERPELDKPFVAARVPTEEGLANIWSQIIGIEQVGIHDNFFDLGGDSILAVQIIAKANQSGLKLSVRQLLDHQTIAELAAVTGTAEALQIDQGIVTGPVMQTPIQQWLLAQSLPELHHYNQTMLLQVPEGLDLPCLEEAVRLLMSHHDALRLRFTQAEGGWEQVNAGVGESVPVAQFDWSQLPVPDQPAALEAAINETQASLNLSQGPILRVVHFGLGTGRSGRLLLAIHHLAVDGISWRILLEDLQTAYEALRRGEPVSLSPKTTSFQDWAQRLAEHAQSAAVLAEAPYWLSRLDTGVRPLPVDFEGQANTEASARIITVSLPAEETRQLLQDVPAAYNTQINDVLLTALVQATAQWTGERQLLLDVEGHGREEIIDNVDISRTVGWFTSLFPVLLDLRTTQGYGAALKTVKEQLRGIPSRGIGYGLLRYLSPDTDLGRQLRTLPQAAMQFNYLGQFNQLFSASSLFAPAVEPPGAFARVASPKQPRPYLIEILSMVVNEELRMMWLYSANVHHHDTVVGLANDFITCLRDLISHCGAQTQRHFTPSDFPLANLNQANLDKLAARLQQQNVSPR